MRSTAAIRITSPCGMRISLSNSKVGKLLAKVSPDAESSPPDVLRLHRALPILKAEVINHDLQLDAMLA